MRRLARFLPCAIAGVLVCAAAVLAPAAVAETRLEATDLPDHPFTADLPSGSRLDLRVRSGDVHVIGVDQDRISVELSGRSAHDARARELKVQFRNDGGSARLRISGGPKNDLTITVRVPRRTDLHARIPFGEVRIENIVGDQDVEVHAGDLTVAVGDPADYAHVDASVFTGEVEAAPFGESHGGLFRSFRQTGTGRYRLHAHVGAGQLTLE
jgi:hypothetical protein